MEPITNTEELVNLLKELHDNEYAGVSGYLQGVLKTIENEYPQTKETIQYFINQVGIDLNNKRK